MIISVIAIIYLLSVGASYLYTHVAYSKGGIYEDHTPDTFDLFITFYPAYNTLYSLIAWFGEWPFKEVEEPKEDCFLKDRSKFFKVKK